MAWEYVFQGRVQGVGFRFRTATIARRHAVTGFVRNLPGGDVQMIVDGVPSVVEAFISDVQQQMKHYINEVTRQEVPLDQPLLSFEIRR